MDLEDLASTAREEHERKLRQEFVEAAKRKARLINPIEFCTSIDAALNDFDGASEPAEPSQRKRLEKAGFDLDAIKNSAHADQLIAALDLRWRMNLATPKQLRVLKRCGYRHADTASFAEASAFIDSLDARRKPQPQAVAA